MESVPVIVATPVLVAGVVTGLHVLMAYVPVDWREGGVLVPQHQQHRVVGVDGAYITGQLGSGPAHRRHSHQRPCPTTKHSVTHIILFPLLALYLHSPLEKSTSTVDTLHSFTLFPSVIDLSVSIHRFEKSTSFDIPLHSFLTNLLPFTLDTLHSFTL